MPRLSTSSAIPWVAVLAAVASAGAVAPGDSLAEVRANLGVPRGAAERQGRQVLFYPHGEVELQSGSVVRVALRSPEEQAALDDRREKAQREREELQARRSAEGTALRDRKLADADFKAAPLVYQISFWQDFARRYPGVSVSEPLAIARLRFAELEAKRLKDEAEAARRAEREEYLAARERETVYPLYTGYRSYRRDRYYPVGLGPISYTFYDKPLPPYTTPSGNPAGELRGSLVDWRAASPVETRVEQRDTGRAEGRVYRGHAGGRGHCES